MKPFLISVSILILCGLENIGHYFGVCFHGMMAQFAGGLVVILMSLGMYSKQIRDWLGNCYAKPDHKCNCKEHHNHESRDQV